MCTVYGCLILVLAAVHKNDFLTKGRKINIDFFIQHTLYYYRCVYIYIYNNKSVHGIYVNRSYKRLLMVLVAGKVLKWQFASSFFYFFMNLFPHHLHKWNDVLSNEAFGANQSWQVENRTISVIWKTEEALKSKVRTPILNISPNVNGKWWNFHSTLWFR